MPTWFSVASRDPLSAKGLVRLSEKLSLKWWVAQNL